MYVKSMEKTIHSKRCKEVRYATNYHPVINLAIKYSVEPINLCRKSSVINLSQHLKKNRHTIQFDNAVKARIKTRYPLIFVNPPSCPKASWACSPLRILKTSNP